MKRKRRQTSKPSLKKARSDRRESTLRTTLASRCGDTFVLALGGPILTAFDLSWRLICGGWFSHFGYVSSSFTRPTKLVMLSQESRVSVHHRATQHLGCELAVDHEFVGPTRLLALHD